VSVRGRIVGLVLGALACAAPPPPESEVAIAASRVHTPAGVVIDPLDDREHDIVVLVFVTPDCPVSNRYAPELRRIAASTPAERVAWWLVYPDPDLDAAAIAAHREAYALPWPAVLDPAHELVARAQAVVTPEVAVFVGSDAPTRVLAYHGRIDDRIPELGRARPEPNVRDLQDALTAVLASSSVARASAPAVGCPIGDLR
jgi:AhpC/TSA family